MTLALGAVACSESAPTSEGIPLGSGGEPSVVEGKIDFYPASTGSLNLAPSELAELTVLVSPKGEQWVTFDLISTPSEFDGYLLEARSQVNQDGFAKVQLRAPSKKAEFLVRAHLASGASATREVRVTSMGFGTLQILPVYNGSRTIESWDAALYAGKSCDKLDNTWGDDATSKGDKSTPVLDSVPAQTTVAVVLWGDELASGCATITDLAQKETRQLAIEVMDRPLALNDGQLDLAFAIETTIPEFGAHLDEAVVTGAEQLRDEGYSDAELLLSRMTTHVSQPDPEEFEMAMETVDFTSLTSELWGSPTALSDGLTRALTATAQTIRLQGSLSGTLELEGAESVFTPGAELGEAMATSTWMVSRDSGDTVVLGGTITYSPLGWLLALVQSQGQFQRDVRCEDLAVELVAAGAESLTSCDEKCLQSSCSEAVEDLLLGIDTEESTATILISATAKASVTGPARIAALEGTWIGSMLSSSDGSVAALNGTLIGHASE